MGYLLATNEEKLVRLFNSKAQKAIEQISELCGREVDKTAENIALFFKNQKDQLDLEAVGDFLGTESAEHRVSKGHEFGLNEKLLTKYTEALNFADKPFVESLRIFLNEFKLPGEAQKIDRLMEAFANRYHQQNPAKIASKDAAYILSFQTIMLNTDLHNASIASDKKITLEGLKRNLKGFNKKNDGPVDDFPKDFLEDIYNEIKANPFKFNFSKQVPGITIEPKAGELEQILNNLKNSELNIQIDEPKSWLKKFTGYQSKITVTDKDGCSTLIQTYEPGWLTFKKPSVVIQPGEADDAQKNQNTLALTAKIAAGFSSPIKSLKATYAYQVEDMMEFLPEKIKQNLKTQEQPKPTLGKWRMFLQNTGKKDSPDRGL